MHTKTKKTIVLVKTRKMMTKLRTDGWSIERSLLNKINSLGFLFLQISKTLNYSEIAVKKSYFLYFTAHTTYTPRAIIEQNRTEHVVEYYYRVSVSVCVYVITNEYTSLEEERDKSSSNFREAAQRANKTTNL